MMSIEKNAIAQQAAEQQVKHIKQQLTANAPERLSTTGAETVINEIGPFGCTIDQPGKYVLGKDINWASTSGAIAAITIESGGVVLDFKGYGISTVLGDDPSHSVIGVIVHNAEQACAEVTIKNGSIQNMGLCGIWAWDTNELTISGMTIDGLTHDSFDLAPAAVSLFGADFFHIENCQANDISVTSWMAGGFFVFGSKNGTLKNCSVNEFENKDGLACGFPYMMTNDIITDQCSVTSLTSKSAGSPKSDFGHTCIGYMVGDCNNLQYLSCSASHLHGCCDDCHGISMWPGNNVLISNFTASHIHDGLGPQKTGAKATGVEVHGNNIKVIDCHAEDITAIVPQFLQAAGFSACGNSITFENCTATGVAVLDADGQLDPTHIHGYGTGFGWAPDPRIKKPAANEITYLNCAANDCQLGFDTWNHQHSTWSNPSTSGTGEQVCLIQPTGAIRVLSQNFCSEQANSKPGGKPVDYQVKNVIESATNHYPSGWTTSSDGEGSPS